MMEEEKKPFYKKWWFWLIIAGSAFLLFLFVAVFAFVIFAVSIGGESTNSENNVSIEENIENENHEPEPSEEKEDTVNENVENENNDNNEEEPEEESIEDEIKDEVNHIVDEDLDDTEVTEIRVNEDASVDEERYIVLVNLTWNVNNKPKRTAEMINMYSARLAVNLEDYDKIYELVDFWEVPYHKEGTNIIKNTYENTDDGMERKDLMKDPDIF